MARSQFNDILELQSREHFRRSSKDTASCVVFHRTVTLAICLCSSFVAGCTDTTESEKSVHVSGSNDKPKVIVLEHDFGAVAPSSSNEHLFEIHNNSDVLWTVSRVVSTCSCTVVKVEPSRLPPGAKGVAKVLLSAGAEDGSVDKTVAVEFAEPNCPAYRLMVKAQIRNKLTILPTGDISFGELSSAQTATQTIEVLNYSETGWKDLKCSSVDNWLSCKVLDKTDIPTAGAYSPRQRFRLNVIADSARIPFGPHTARLTLLAVADSEAILPSRSVQVECAVIPPVRAIPARVFLGNVSTHKAIARISVCFAPSAIPKSPSEVSVTSTLKDHINVNWVRSEGRLWQLDVKCNDVPPVLSQNETLDIAVDNIAGASISLPIILQVN